MRCTIFFNRYVIYEKRDMLATIARLTIENNELREEAEILKELIDQLRAEIGPAGAEYIKKDS